ncbi:hypothetical protein [Cohnella rhizosphaerae]|uniref:Uncharacterized protein n=1 Tax=Cohnella rhizosphaerae TaxID=1457232 RepID=A0A9X4KVW7_9BACL|nr:hypothetical protein [Cohnella rhizosphaerae]MDG0812115.1 hypothetical protein [Cohnella rhizosphaerae]
MAIVPIYAGEQLLISADPAKGHVHIELSSTGYRERYVSLYVERAEELQEMIDALVRAKRHLTD